MYIYIIIYTDNDIGDWGLRHPGVAGGEVSAVSPIAFRPELNSSQEGAPLQALWFLDVLNMLNFLRLKADEFRS